MDLFARNCPPWVLLLSLLLASGCGERKLGSPTPQMDAPEEFWVRVLLEKELTQCLVYTDSGFQVIVPDNESVQPPVQHPAGTAKLHTADGRIVLSNQPFAASRIVIFPHEPYVFKLNGVAYRGKLQVTAGPAGDFELVNLVPLEPYLAGVVGAEMPQYWEPQALRAQAVAARTYCMYIKKRFGSGRSWDVRKTQANQVYLGLAAESAQIWQAVNSTAGDVLMSRQPDGTKALFPSYYSAACGGHTENAENVFGEHCAPLSGVECPYCRHVARPGLFLWPMVKIEKEAATASLFQKYPQLKRLGQIVQITPAQVSRYGGFERITSIKLTGCGNSTDFLRAEDFRLTLDPTGRRIRSTAFKISDGGRHWVFLGGRGYGHAAGMCQCGAQYLARRGKAANLILKHYYPDSEIISLY